MSFTRVRRSLISLVLILALLMLCACSEKELPSHEDTASGTSDNISFEETDEVTDFVKMEMVGGGIVLMELYPSVAPITVANFKSLVKKGFYNGLIFHRVVADFVIQTGDPTGLGNGGSSETIKGEFGINGFSNPLSHSRGVMSMARLGNDHDSANSQFFICLTDCSSSLDGRYASFGKVIAGMDVVDRIGAVQVVSNSRPIEAQTISSIKFVKVNK